MISINLLPSEVTQKQKENQKFRKLQSFSLIILLLFIFLTIGIFGLRFLQSQNINQSQKQLSEIENKVNSYQKKEIAITVLKNRLVAISQFAGASSKQRAIYNLITSLIPAPISVSSIIVDKGGTASLSLATSDNLSLSDFIFNLLSKEKNESMISAVTIETLSRGRDGVYRVTLKIRPKG